LGYIFRPVPATLAATAPARLPGRQSEP
jgi:hypothetical protein